MEMSIRFDDLGRTWNFASREACLIAAFLTSRRPNRVGNDSLPNFDPDIVKDRL